MGLVGLGAVTGASGPALTTYTSPLLLEFAYGVMIGFLFDSGFLPLKLSRHAAWSLIAAGGIIAVYAAAFLLPRPFDDFYTSRLRPFTYGTTAVLVVVGALELESSARRGDRLPPLLAFLKLTGDASYALYLNHLFSIAILSVIWLKLDLGRGVVQGLAFAIACVVFAVVVAILSYWILERPVTKALQRRLAGGGAPPLMQQDRAVATWHK